MGPKLITADEMGRRGGTTRAKRYSKAQIRAWGKLGGRPRKLDKSALRKLRRMLREGVPKREIAKTYGISTRSLTRYPSGSVATVGLERDRGGAICL